MQNKLRRGIRRILQEVVNNNVKFNQAISAYRLGVRFSSGNYNLLRDSGSVTGLLYLGPGVKFGP